MLYCIDTIPFYHCCTMENLFHFLWYRSATTTSLRFRLHFTSLVISELFVGLWNFDVVNMLENTNSEEERKQKNTPINAQSMYYYVSLSFSHLSGSHWQMCKPPNVTFGPSVCVCACVCVCSSRSSITTQREREIERVHEVKEKTHKFSTRFFGRRHFSYYFMLR